ncbi:ribosome small subunit-dependent GTPase A [Mesomycoplasma molare]|uniref:Small ribosomal subunit biogenesis GTPase RsgA n=1 Tax=Mesomycoplasma molare TaxID=171288 RepID=A0ABY5TY20_9BACT|nr:ribosome small subunit-dependent GTPase A [Mesomycoplasma molare]UWD34466.1 ribosome small subunit-dependent GTPase A [Mesomycoplasma molare]
MEKGKVIRIIAGFYDILDQNNNVIRLRGSGKLRNSDVLPVVGDIVEYEKNGMVNKILERKNFFIRPKIANIDQVIVVISLKEPDFSSFLLDKFLLIIESKKIKPIIIFTKVDLFLDFDLIAKDYKKMNYDFFFINNKEKESENIKKLKPLFKNKISVFMGQTGVGKTSLINNLSDQDFQTQEISKSLNRGKHTTRVVQMIEWNGGFLIDTPGFSSFSLDINKEEINQSFAIFRENFIYCKYRSCLHYKENEEDCKIKLMVKQEEIPLFRYENYINLLKEFLKGKNEKN